MAATEAFDDLVDADLWVDVAALGAGYMASSISQTVIDGISPFDVPNEAYGAGVAYVGYTVDFEYSTEMAHGGALYTVDSLAQRANLKNRVTSFAEGN